MRRRISFDGCRMAILIDWLALLLFFLRLLIEFVNCSNWQVSHHLLPHIEFQFMNNCHAFNWVTIEMRFISDSD